MSPINIGVESELYTRFNEDDAKDTSVEEWFAEAIDGPASDMIKYLLDPPKIRRRPFRGDLAKARVVKELGFRVNSYADSIILPADVRDAIARYLAALLVRNPTYLAKLVHFHQNEALSRAECRDLALDNMLYLYRLYLERIQNAVLIVTRAVGTAEYLYADGGLMVEEPWRQLHGIPFDIHAPLTPELAIQVLPVPLSGDLGSASIMEATDRGVARQNRIVLGAAKRFVFSRRTPPSSFISKNFGQAAPKNIGYRITNGRLETTYDPLRK